MAADILTRSKTIVVKLLSRDVSHKSDVGGVVLGIRTAKAAQKAAEGIVERLSAKVPDARVDGFTVQAMIERPNAHELIIGVNEDNLFGPFILFGAGGTSVEVVADTAIALPPLDLKLARDLIAETRIAKLLNGYRDRAAADIDAIALTLMRVSQMIVDCPEIAALDINPLLADADGVVALDARVVVDPKRVNDRAPNARLAIRPYPAAWEKRVKTISGREIELRPIRPEDAHLYGDFTAKLEDRDLRLRILAPRKFFAHDFLARLTQIDYAREMAFVAIDPADDDTGGGALLGVSRLVADADYTRADYAIIVRSDVKGLGIGWSLMEQLLAYARAEGLKLLEGMVLAENTQMLEMCRKLGFTVTVDPVNPGLCTVRMEFSGPMLPPKVG